MTLLIARDNDYTVDDRVHVLRQYIVEQSLTAAHARRNQQPDIASEATSLRDYAVSAVKLLKTDGKLK
ncbi:MAG: hypothetical protein AAFQ07_07245 [Chloroflexota bacterium]